MKAPPAPQEAGSASSPVASVASTGSGTSHTSTPLHLLISASSGGQIGAQGRRGVSKAWGGFDMGRMVVACCTPSPCRPAMQRCCLASLGQGRKPVGSWYGNKLGQALSWPPPPLSCCLSTSGAETSALKVPRPPANASHPPGLRYLSGGKEPTAGWVFLPWKQF